jgi:hypothetical protein
LKRATSVPFAASALIVVAAVAAEVVFPGRDLYHAGWFNVALLAIACAGALAARRQFARTPDVRARAAIAAVACGAAVAALAGAASGLLAPENRTVVAAPGARVALDDFGGALEFPAVENGAGNGAGFAGAVLLQRPGRRPLPVGEGGRNAGSFILHTVPRQVVYVEARDARGGRLTITQPSGSSFLSPVLLMQQTQSIAGFDLPFDSFAVPAAHRDVRAVLFNAQQAATLRPMAGNAPAPAVLFAVDDENDRPLPRGIELARDGSTVAVGGLLLHAAVLAYPAVEIVAAPALPAVVAGAVLVLGGLAVRQTQRRL